MLISDMLTRIRFQVEDPNSYIYSDDEILAAINLAKDEVLTIILAISNDFIQNTTTLSFTAGQRERAFTLSTIFGIVRVEDAERKGRTIRTFKEFDDLNDDELYYRTGTSSATMFLGRKDTTKAETFTIYVVDNVGDYPAGGTIAFGIKPVPQLIMIKATIALLSSRARDTKRWEIQEQKIEMLLDALVLKYNRSQKTRYVHYVID